MANSSWYLISFSFERPAPSYEELVGLIAGKLSLLPRYRQRVRFVPYNLGHPVWVDDPHFRLSYHVHRMALPAPGGAAELQQLVGWVMSQRLDRSRPLWETWLVEGLPDGWAPAACRCQASCGRTAHSTARRMPSWWEQVMVST